MRTGGAVIDLHQTRIKKSVLLICSIFLTFQLLRPGFLFGHVNAACNVISENKWDHTPIAPR
jgi:hypothetical protein